jgi:hypothetical protein
MDIGGEQVHFRVSQACAAYWHVEAVVVIEKGIALKNPSANVTAELRGGCDG